MNIYTDRKKHKDDTFTDKKQRNITVKELRNEGWNVKVGVYHYPDPELSTVYWYEACK